MASLDRSLGLGQVIFFGVGSILGAGIYTLIGKVAGHAGNLTWLAFIIASFTALLTAFSYAELSAAYPRSGGEYVYVKHAFGQRLGTFIGLVIASNGIISAATVSLGFAGYFTQLIQFPIWPIAIGILVLLFAVNAIGIQASSNVNMVLTGVEILGLVVVGVAAFPQLGTVDLLQSAGKGMDGLFFAAVLSFFAYVGFEDIVKLAGETKDAQRNIPRALFAASGIVFVIYTSLAVLVVGALPWQELANSPAPLAAIMENEWGRAGAAFIAVAALFSTGNTMLSNMLGSSRVLAYMGRDVRPMKWMTAVSKRRTPVRALVLILLVACAFAAIGDIEVVARIATITIFLTFLVVNLSVIALRVKQPDLERPYRIPLNIGRVPVISVLGVLCTIVLLGYAVASI
ncbi:MAG: APC family permease [Flavobacteriales bacterium]